MRNNRWLLPTLLPIAMLCTPAAFGSQAPPRHPAPKVHFGGFKTRDKTSLASPARRHDEVIRLINGGDERNRVGRDSKQGRRRPAVSVRQF